MTGPERILWIDLAAASQTAEPPAALRERFDVRRIPGKMALHSREYLQKAFDAHNPLCAFYDCDYVDRPRVVLVRDMKSHNAQVPFVLTVLQHSEALAVWAFRQGAMDYLVKPVPGDELDNCIRRLAKISEFRRSPQQRHIYAAAAEIPETVARSNAVARDRLAPAVFYVQQHYSKRIYSDAVARLCGLSPTYFSKAFHQRFGMGFQEFLLRYRIAKACNLLESAAASISDVSYAVGFREPSYFSRIFRRYVGVAPSEYGSTGTGHGPIPALCHLIEDAGTSSSQVVRALASGFG
ncbi:MAG TPA: helix-turn-helix domain-containing protein [Woeseiaceae bacterium]|nr:helix-turn-helix domain-containing protein [Woeseiaceae bacterium]